ncbi:MAG: multicopper oxidase domain-containing protein [Thermoproteota archaeon]|nr:multicopper oxidase domain-containing protein [Thermoproteota archaeon]
MNKEVLAGIVAGVLVAGLIFSPIFLGQSHVTQAQAATAGKTEKVLLIASEKVVQVAPDDPLHPGGIKYNAMVFNGTVPGPVISLTQGDNVQITLRNDGKVIHSLDFHMGYGASQANSGAIQPGKSFTWTINNPAPGAWFYHCSADALNGIWEHISNGMYGGTVVHPLGEQPAKEFYMVFGQLFNTADQGLFNGTKGKVGSFDLKKFVADQPDLMLTNGMAFKYTPAVGQIAKIPLNNNATVFKVKPGELTRWYIFNAGPNDGVSFHFIGGYQSAKYGFVNGTQRLLTQDQNDQVNWIPPAGGQVIESTFPLPGVYVGVDHNMNHVLKGAAFAVLAANNATAGDQPPGTWVPPKSSNFVSSEQQPAAVKMMSSAAGAKATK